MRESASDLACRLARDAEAVCRHYWQVGDVTNTPGRSLFVRLKGSESGDGAAGKWTKYLAPRVMLRMSDRVLSHGRPTPSTQHSAGALRGVA